MLLSTEAQGRERKICMVGMTSSRLHWKLYQGFGKHLSSGDVKCLVDGSLHCAWALHRSEQPSYEFVGFGGV